MAEIRNSIEPRIVAIDVLRGFALLGIVGANIVLYDIDSVAKVEPTFQELPVSDFGAPFMLFVLVFVINKMMAVFSMLFGAGVILAADKATPNSTRPAAIYYRRNLLLLAFGLLHMAIWIGDILTVYALCALVLYLFRKVQPKILLGLAAVVWYWAPLAWLTFGIGPQGDEYFSRAFAMMLVGMALFRLGIINGKREKAWYRTWMLRSLLFGLPFVSLAWFSNEYASSINNLGVPAMAFSYVCAIMWLCQTNLLSQLCSRLAAAGQLALTNYISQTVLGIAFYQALEILGLSPNATLLGIGMLLIWLLQLWWSPIWLKYYAYGPLEWLWRSATYKKWFAIART